MPQFDYIIVGAGSAGSALASRLSDDTNTTVLLLEAGGSDRSLWIQVPIGYGKIFHDARVNWKYTTEPDPNLNGARVYWPRGKVLGGSSSINAMVYVRGHRRDFDDWGALAPGWAWNDVAPVFKRIEAWDGDESDLRGRSGPLAVHDVAPEVHPLTRTFLQAANQCNIATNPDYNGASMDGAACYQITTRGGVRASAARAYLKPARRRANLTVCTGAMATRVLIDRMRATGVEYRHKGQLQTVRARRNVILCGGAINSPQLLQLSGIGPGAVLQRQGIKVLSDAPQVGRNLRDHLGADTLLRARVPSLNQQLRPWWGKFWAGLQYVLARKGPLSLSLNQGGGFVRLTPQADRPDLQLYFSPVSYTRAPVGTRPLMNPDPFPGFLLGFNPCRPTSTGHLEIRSPDPYTPPLLQGNYLSTQYDIDLMRAGMRLMRRIAAAPALAAVIDSEISPGCEVQTDAQIDAYLRDKSWSVFHQCGTCRMGADAATSVVDARLRVHGIDGLRVADASIFPTIPTGNTNAPAIMVGEKAADIIRQDARQGKGSS